MSSRAALRHTLETGCASFRSNVESVYKLMNFDRVVMDFALQNVEALHERLQSTSAADRPWLNAEHTVAALKRVRQNDSLRLQYRTIFNQCDVLLVSYFAATTGDLFKACLPERLRRSKDKKFLKQDMKVTFADLKENEFDLIDRFAELFIEGRDISFQDMGSIARAFGDFIGFEPPRTDHVNNIIAAQACRNAIVHAGSIADRRLVRQVQDAHPRQVQLDIQEGQLIEFRPEEVEQVGTSMQSYIGDLVDGLMTVFPEMS
jgi:hypothetical protein